MKEIREKKEWILQQIKENSQYGQVTTMNELSRGISLTVNELHPMLDDLVDHYLIQWTSEEHVVSYPLPDWYLKQLRAMTNCHEQAVGIRSNG